MPEENKDQQHRSYRRPSSGSRKPSTASKRVTDSIGTIGGSYVRDDRKFGFDEDGLHIPTGNSEILLSRRQLLFGAAGLAGIAAVGGAATAIGGMSEDGDAIDSLAVAESDVFTLDDCAEVPMKDVMTLLGEYKLPYGSLVWAGCDTVAACLKPTDKASPLVTASLLSLTGGYEGTVLSAADGQDEGYEIYDMRASDEGAIWTEANILTGDWRVFVALISSMELQEHHLVDEGNAGTEMPTLAAIGTNAFWQVIPVEPPADDEDADEGETNVRMVAFGKPKDVKTIFTAPGRCATAIAPANTEQGVVITRRHPEAQSRRQMMLIGQDGAELDSITFPSRMVPMEACYGASGFAFSFESIYNYGDGIANLGTYTPQAKPDTGQYSHRSWFRFARTPSMPPSWCDGWLMVKSTSAVVGIDLQSKRYTIFPTDNNAETYGDCLASIGDNGTVVLFTNIDRTAAVQDSEKVSEDDKLCLVRVYTTKANAENVGSGDEVEDESEYWDEEYE